ncbi:MAG: ABC transporter substrate-binding protein [Rhodovulum sp.]
MRISSALALAAAHCIAPATLHAAQGVDRDSVRFVQIAPLEGVGAAWGTGMRLGLLAAFEEANRQGGVHGRRIRLDSHCDSNDPAHAVERMESIIAADDHFALIGTVGATVSRTLQPLASSAGMALVGAATGDEALRAPWATNVINIRPTDAAEIRALARHLADTHGTERIGVLHENDEEGRALLRTVEAALAARGLEPVAKSSYAHGTTAIKVALLTIRRASPDAVLMLGGHDAAAEFIKLAESLDFAPVFAGLSDTDALALGAELGDAADGVLVAGAVPDPWDETWGVVADYRSALTDHDRTAEPGFASLEGYIAGRLALAALDEAGPWLDRAGFLAALGRLGELDLGGLELAYGAGDNQGLDDAFLIRLGADGTFETLPPATADGDN